MTRTKLCVGLGAIVFAGSAIAAGQDLASPAETSAFVAALDTCTTSTMRAPHPLMPSFVVDHTIAGEGNGNRKVVG